MAQCILCKATIPDGTQYCDSCEEKMKQQADESYLDSLLSSIAPSDEESAISLYKKSKPQASNKEENLHQKKSEESGQVQEETGQNEMNTHEEAQDNVNVIPKDYNIFSKSEDDSDLDFLDEIFDQAMESPQNMQETDTKPEAEELKEYEIPDTKETTAASEVSELPQEISAGVETQPPQIEEPLQTEVESSASEEKHTADNQSSDEDADILELINQINQSEELPEVEEVPINLMENQDKSTPEVSEKDLLDLIPDINERSNEAKEEAPFIKDESEIATQPETGSKEEKPVKEKSEKKTKKKTKKKNIFARIFGNIKEERTEEEIQALHEAAIKEGEALIAAKQEKLEQAKLKKEQDKINKAEAAKKAKEEAAKKKANKVQKAKEKKEAKEQKAREIQELIDEIDENEGKINKLGAGIIFALFAAIAVVIVIGTNMFTYTISIQNATKNFEIQRYNEAYKDVYGIDIKDEDIEIYDKIMTVMYVNKQLNSYENYYNMKDYPKALDSLLKGLERYDKYYTLATLLGIESDLDYVKNQILGKLDDTFHVTEAEARKLLSYQNQMTYSTAVYKLAIERMQTAQDTNTTNN